jgi:hypothetical protein
MASVETTPESKSRNKPFLEALEFFETLPDFGSVVFCSLAWHQNCDA